MARGQRKVRPGEKLKNTISATVWNSMIDALGWIENFKRNDKHQERESRDGIVQAKNESYQDFSQFNVAALRNILFTPNENLPEFKNNYAFRTAIYEEDDKFRWGITQQPTPNGAIGPVCVSGPTLARVNVSDHTHTHAKPIVGNHKQLESGKTGAKILWKEPDIGDDKWAVILLPEGGDGESLRLLPFELMQDRSASAPIERLPVILVDSYTGDVCDLPPSNPDAEAMISDWSTLVATWPYLNAQLVWFHDSQYPFSKGPMEAGDGGAAADSGALGLLAYHPDVSLEDDDDAEENEDYCKKRFEVITCDQSAMMFETQAKYAFPYADDIGTIGSNLDGNNPGDNGTFGDHYFIMGYPTPLGQWPFSQREHSEYWDAYPSETAPAHTSRIGNPLRYCGAVGDHGVIERKNNSNDWILVSTQVRNVTALGELTFEDCAVKSKQKRFRAYSRADGGELTPDYEVELQLYEGTYATGEMEYVMRAANGVSSPVGDYTDVCVLVPQVVSPCFLFAPEPSSTGVYSDATQAMVPVIDGVSIGASTLDFSTVYVFRPGCDPPDSDPIQLPLKTTCEE